MELVITSSLKGQALRHGSQMRVSFPVLIVLLAFLQKRSALAALRLLILVLVPAALPL